MPRSLVTLFALLCLAATATAATLHVSADGSGEYATIQAALNAAADGDVIELGPGTYAGWGNYNLEFYDDVTLRGTGDPALTVLDARPGRAFNLAEETGGTVENLTVRFGSGTDGGAVYTGWGTYTFRDCRFLDNATAGVGGVWMGDQSGVITFQGCLFARNSADDTGGVLAATDSVDLTVRGCTFVQNDAPQGSCIDAVTDASVTVTESILAWNRGGAATRTYYASLALGCTNIFGNPGGDFPTGYTNLGDNITADPRLRDPWATVPDVDLAVSSPCLEDMNCGTMGCGAELDEDGCTYRLDADGTGMLPTIQAAVDLAVHTDDVILLADGVYTGDGNHDIATNYRSFTLRSVSYDPTACRLDAAGAGRHLSITGHDAHVRLRGLGFHNGMRPDGFSGGSVLIRPGSIGDPQHVVEISDCIFRHNTSGAVGGAIDMQMGTLIMDDTVLELNTAGWSAGAIHTLETLVQANACRLESNVSLGDPIAGWRLQSPVEGSFFTEVDMGNHAGQGLTVLGLDHAMTFTSCTFWDNESTGAGAGIQFSLTEGGDPILEDCEFHGNLSGSWGGGVYSNGQLATVNCRFINNRALLGGGMYVASSAVMTGSTYSGNTATDPEIGSGGGASIHSGLVSDCVFVNNTALRGGGLQCVNLIIPLSGCTFQDNTAAEEGGGLMAWGNVTGCDFLGNQAHVGGGAFLLSGDVELSTFRDNTAVADGAALLLQEGYRLSRSTLTGNALSAAYLGGQVAAGRLLSQDDEVPPILEQCVIAYGSHCSVMEWQYIDDYEHSITPSPHAPAPAQTSLFWSNDQGVSSMSELTVAASCILTSPPGFCDLAAGDLTLVSASPALPANNASGVLMGRYGQGCDHIVAVDQDVTPAFTALLGNHPNPFNPSTTVDFSLSHDGHAVVEVLNLKGERVAVLMDAALTAGEHEARWDGRDATGREAPSGVYLARLTADGAVRVQRMAMIR